MVFDIDEFYSVIAMSNSYSMSNSYGDGDTEYGSTKGNGHSPLKEYINQFTNCREYSIGRMGGGNGDGDDP